MDIANIRYYLDAVESISFGEQRKTNPVPAYFRLIYWW